MLILKPILPVDVTKKKTKTKTLNWKCYNKITDKKSSNIMRSSTYNLSNLRSSTCFY